MLRNCVLAAAAWVVSCGAYGYFLRAQLPLRTAIITALLIGTMVWLGLMILSGARFALSDWTARSRMMSGERPKDGDAVSVAGEIRAAFEPLQSPVSGRACVLYAYDIGAESHGETSARDYAGFGMTRCTLYTPHGTFGIGSLPLLEDVPKTKGDRARAAEYVRQTQFEPLDNVRAVTSLVMRVFSETPPFRKDWRIGEPRMDVEHGAVYERIIAPGDLVTVTGRYNAARNELSGDLEDKGYLRLVKGGTMTREDSLPWKAIRQVFAGVAIIIAANAILWLVLQRMPR